MAVELHVRVRSPGSHNDRIQLHQQPSVEVKTYELLPTVGSQLHTSLEPRNLFVEVQIDGSVTTLSLLQRPSHRIAITWMASCFNQHIRLPGLIHSRQRKPQRGTDGNAVKSISLGIVTFSSAGLVAQFPMFLAVYRSASTPRAVIEMRTVPRRAPAIRNNLCSFC